MKSGADIATDGDTSDSPGTSASARDAHGASPRDEHGRGYLNRIVGYETRAARSIVPHNLNWREHPAVQRAALAGILSEVGWVQNVVVNQRTGKMIDGHLRVEIAAARNEDVPVTLVDLDEDEEAYVLATLDPIAALATTNDAALRELLTAVQSNDEAVRNLLAGLAGEKVDPFADLVGDGDVPDASFAYDVTVTCHTARERDAVVDAIEKAGYHALVKTLRGV